MPAWLWIAVGSWYLGANAAAAIAFWWDKRAARRGRRRLRERTLLGLVWLGGFLGAPLAMRVARHKTQKPAFRLGWVAALTLHTGAWLALWRGL